MLLRSKLQLGNDCGTVYNLEEYRAWCAIYRSQLAWMEPALFSPADLFGHEESDEKATTASETYSEFSERSHAFPGVVLLIREFSFHQVNANLLWPGTPLFAKWLVEHLDMLEGRRVLELGSGTGALAIFLKKAFAVDITTSDFDDEAIEKNIAHNCEVNGVPVMQHIRHTWGDKFPVKSPDWDLIIASDILLYVKQYANLMKTILFLLQNYAASGDSTFLPDVRNINGAAGWNLQNISRITDRNIPASWILQSEQRNHMMQGHKEGSVKSETVQVTSMNSRHIESSCKFPTYSKDSKVDIQSQNCKGVAVECTRLPKPCFLMSWRRRLPKDDEALFFDGCKASGLFVQHLGSRVYCIFQQ